MRRAINCEYCAPKSRTTMDWVSTDEFLRLTVQLQQGEKRNHRGHRGSQGNAKSLVILCVSCGYRTLSHHNIHELLRHDDDLHNLLARNRRAHLFVSECSFLDLKFVRARRHYHQPAQLPANLHGDLDFVLRSEE